jgi:hypothetical protein
MSQAVIERNGAAILGRIPLNRFGNENGLKGATVFLASAASDFVTGHLVAVDGGPSARIAISGDGAKSIGARILAERGVMVYSII